MSEWKPILDMPKGVACFVYRMGRMPVSAIRFDWGERDLLVFPNEGETLKGATHFSLVSPPPEDEADD